MAQLAIQGHSTRGSEVIALLEMLGGINASNWYGQNDYKVYFISENDYINQDSIAHIKQIKQDTKFIIYTLEQFLAKFPHKVGDKVSSKYLKNYKIEKMEWEVANNRVIYKLQGFGWYAAYELQPYKEETMDIPNKLKPVIDLSSYSKDEYIIKLGDYEIKEIDGVLKAIRKQPQYPKTYEECHKILGVGEREVLFDGATASEEYLFDSFLKLKRCRDAYWKVAGDWKPNERTPEDYFFIVNKHEDIIKDRFLSFNHILSFPTEEMRDAFYENFKDLIEQCKELL